MLSDYIVKFMKNKKVQSRMMTIPVVARTVRGNNKWTLSILIK